MTDRPIFYSFRRCPYAMRARLALAVSGQTVELREVVLRDKPAEMLAISPKGTVPVLLLPDGSVIDESLDIMHWALRQNDPENWLAGDDPTLIAANDGPFKTALDRYKYPHRYGLASGEAYRATGLDWLFTLEKRLMTQPFLTGGSAGLADFALFPFIRQFAATDRQWFEKQALSKLQKWLITHLNSAIFYRIMERYDPWKAGGAAIVFGD